MGTRARFSIAATIVASAIGCQGSANALTEDEAKAILGAIPDAKTRAKVQDLPAFRALAQQQRAVTNAAAVRDANTTSLAQAKTDAKPQPAGPSRTAATNLLLRNDWADLGVLGACLTGVKTASAKGASLSFTQDYVAANRIWAAQGMVAGVYSDCDLTLRPKPGGGDTGFFEKSLAAYAQVNSSYNSNSKLASKNSDTRTFGLSGEIAYLHQGDFEVFRITPSVVQDAIKDTTAVAVMGQYIPLWVSQPGIWHPNFIFNGTVSYQFDPAFDMQYASTTDPKKPIQFSGKNESLRLGPELYLIVQPFSLSDSLLSRIGIHEMFHPWFEAYSSRISYWWANAVTYNLTKDGNFAVAISYNRGLDENSGAMTNQYVLSLNGKI